MSSRYNFNCILILLSSFLVFGAFSTNSLPAKILPGFKVAAVTYDPAWGDLDGNKAYGRISSIIIQ